MPFYNNIYYPLSSEPQGAHSSAGIPSLLSSPQSQPSSGSQGRPDGYAVSGALGGSTAIPTPFKFRARRESVDWRRINAVDVERAACELDFQTLQEHVAEVAFCSLESERCTRCHSQVDPALLKLFRLAQLIVEYLLHSQDCLASSLQEAEQQLQSQACESKQLREQLQKLTQDAKSLKEELKQRKKIITSQQAMISAGLANYHKCQHCEKAFMNTSFLQSHMQRRHPLEYDSKLMTDNEKKVQTMKLAEEVNRLQNQLTLTKSQMEAQQKDYTAERVTEKDLTQKQEEFMKQLEIWKENERIRMNNNIDEIKQAYQRDMDALHQRNINLEKEVLKLQQSSTRQESMQAAQTQAHNRDAAHWQEVSQLQQKFHKQEMKWAAKMKKMIEEYQSERSQLQASLAQMRSSVSEGKEEARRQVKELELRLQEQQRIITSHSMQAKQITSSPPTLVVQREASSPELKARVVASGSSSISEGPADTQSWQQKADELLKQPGLKKDMRLAVQQSLQYKLLDLGIQPGVSGLSKAAYKNVMIKVASGRQQRRTEDPEYRNLQKNIRCKLQQRAHERTTALPSKPKHLGQALSVVQPRPRSSSLPVTVTRVASSHPPRHQHTPQPTYQNRTGSQIPKTSTLLHQKTPPFSSDEDSSEEDEFEENSPQTQKFSQAKVPQVNTSKVRTVPPRVQQCTVPQVVRAPQALTPCPDALQVGVKCCGTPQGPVSSASRTQAPDVDSDSEWTEGSEIEEVALDRLPKLTDQNGNVQKTFNDSVKTVSKNLKQQLDQRGPKKPAGDVNKVPEKSSGVTKTNNVVQELKCMDMNDSEDDWDISSLEDVPSALRPSPALMRKSADRSFDTSTSVWGTSTGKGQKPGLNDAGTGSTLKSSIVTVSDWDDSDNI